MLLLRVFIKHATLVYQENNKVLSTKTLNKIKAGPAFFTLNLPMISY